MSNFLKTFSSALIAIGVGLIVLSAYNLTLGELLAEQNQQARAEVTPLVEAYPDTPAGDIAVGDVFAKLYVPRFGKDYVREIAEGTSVSKVLNTVGVGHYTSSQMPGELGNFALAGHRHGNGGPMRNIDKLVTGDLAYVETAAKRYTYRFLQSKVVSPEVLGVIAPVPEGLSGAVANSSYLTMTTCTPIYVNTDRFIAWFELVGEEPIR